MNENSLLASPAGEIFDAANLFPWNGGPLKITPDPNSVRTNSKPPSPDSRAVPEKQGHTQKSEYQVDRTRVSRRVRGETGNQQQRAQRPDQRLNLLVPTPPRNVLLVCG